MRWGAALVGLVFLGSAPITRPTFDPSDTTRIAQLLRTPANRIEPKLPDEPFEAWLKRTIGVSGRIGWEFDDCGEGPADTVPVCLSANIELPSKGRIDLMLIVGSSELGIHGVPELFWGDILGIGPRVDLKELASLPGELSRARALDARLSRLPDRPVNVSKTIRAVREESAHRVDGALPDSTFESWVIATAGPLAGVRWSAEGCGDRDTSVVGADDWVSVIATIEDSTLKALIQIRVGTCRKGMVDDLRQVRVQLWDKRRSHIHAVELARLRDEIAAIRQQRRH